MNDSALEKKPSAEVWGTLLYNDRFLIVAYAAAAAAIVLLILNLLRLGGSRFVQGVDSIVAVAMAITAQVLALRIRERLKSEARADLLWLAIGVGFGLWALPEAIRMVILFVAPSPHFAALNWLWVMGYIPLYYGFALRYFYVESPLSERQRQVLWGGVGLGLVYVIAVLFLPLVTGRAASPAGGVFSLLYALADLGLLFLLGRIILPDWGLFGGPWKFFAGAFLLKFLSEYVLQSTGNFGAGFLDPVANFIHFGWYGLAALGLFVFDLSLGQQVERPMADVIKEQVGPNASALLFTDEQDNVIKTSINFRYVMRLPEGVPTSGAPVYKVLGIPEAVFKDFKAQVRRQGNTRKYVVEPGYFRAGYKAWITAIASVDQQKKYNGMDMVVQVAAEGVAGAGLNNEERALVENIFYLCGTEGEEGAKLLVAYFNLNYKMLSGLAFKYEGSRRAAGLSEQVNQVAKRQKLLVRVLEQEINVPSEVRLDELGKSVALLLQAARGYVSDLAGTEIVRQETDFLHRAIDRSTQNLIRKYDLARLG